VIDESALTTVRPDLVRCCYRMLGDGVAAEDAAPEALLRMWRARDAYDPVRGSVRTWALAIATRYCLDLLRAAPRRELSTALAGPSRPGDPVGALLPEGRWVTPLPDTGDPAEIADRRETVRMAFIAALQQLSPQQRAVLVLRDVYAFSAAETAAMLDTGPAAVHSALQRARRRIDAPKPAAAEPEVDEQLLADFVTAFERHDVAKLAQLLHTDVVSSMPPMAFWMSGIADVTTAFAATDGCVGHRLIPTSANGGPAFGQYAPAGSVLRPFALLLVEVTGGRISKMTTCLDLTDRFAAFGLPPSLPADGRWPAVGAPT
jgi:RNA polymerase sigma-70 factor (ECF subfamily)